jgi:hypothetical protein
MDGAAARAASRLAALLCADPRPGCPSGGRTSSCRADRTGPGGSREREVPSHRHSRGSCDAAGGHTRTSCSVRLRGFSPAATAVHVARTPRTGLAGRGQDTTGTRLRARALSSWSIGAGGRWCRELLPHGRTARHADKGHPHRGRRPRPRQTVPADVLC